MISLVLLFKHHWVFCWKMASPAKVFLPGRIYKNDMPLPQFAEECLQVLQAPELLGERPHPAGELLQHLGQSGLHCHTPSVSARAKTASHPFPASVELSSSPYYTTSVSWGSCFSPSPFGMIKQRPQSWGPMQGLLMLRAGNTQHVCLPAIPHHA